MQKYKNKDFLLWLFSRNLAPLITWWMIALILILGSIRGIIVINTEFSAKYVYGAASVSLLVLAISGFIKTRDYKISDFILLKNLLKLNLILGILYFAVEVYLGSALDFGLVYLFVAPYIVFLFFRVPDSYLKTAFVVITLAICYSVYDNFMETLKGRDGFENVFAYNLKLRPDTFRALSHTGSIYRAGGYTGSYHDSANILGMSLSFFFIRFLINKKILDLGMFLIALKCITLTQSAANIVLAIFTLLIFTIYILSKNKKVITYFYFVLGGGAVLLLVILFGDVMSVFLERVGSQGDWKGMMNQLDMGSMVMGLPFVFIGHVSAFSSNVKETEVSFLKIVYQLGLVNAVIVFNILLYPLFRFLKFRSICDEALPSLAAIIFGFLSLLHYGSLFRVTSIFLFYAFYSICLKDIYKCSLKIKENSQQVNI